MKKATIFLIIFMQNKANFRKIQMDVNLIITREYEKNIILDTW